MMGYAYCVGRSVVYWSIMLTVYVVLGITTAWRVITMKPVNDVVHWLAMVTTLMGVPIMFLVVKVIFSIGIATGIFMGLASIVLITISATLIANA